MPAVRSWLAILVACFGLAMLGCSSAPRPAAGEYGARAGNTCIARDSVDQTLFASLGLAADTLGSRAILSAELAEQLGMALTEILADWRMPPLSLVADWNSRQLLTNRFHDVVALSPSISQALLLEVGDNGRVRVADETPSDLPSIDSAVRGAIDRASARGALWFLAVADTLRAGDGSTTELLLRVQSSPDSLRPTARLGVIRLPHFELKPAMAAPGGPPIPYPPDLRRQNAEGSVVAEFVVRENGRPDMTTFRVVRTTDAAFNGAVRDHIPRMRFLPATVGGCPVAMSIQTPFNFRLTR